MERRSLGLCLVALTLGACTSSRRPAAAVAPPAAAPAKPTGSYIDLQPGWRVSVITPLLKSGGYRLDPKTLQQVELSAGPGNSLNATMTVGDDFTGYERSYYGVTPNGGGVRVRFATAEVVREGKLVATAKRPVAPLFLDLRRGARHVRLVYLLRSSRADHNMAIVATARPEDLQAITRAINDDPAQGCQPRIPGKNASCHWVPAGIAVRPEMRKPGSSEWGPAR